MQGDTHEPVAERLVDDQLAPVLDLGSGQGRLGGLLPDSTGWFGLDSSPTQLADSVRRPVVLGEASALPFPDHTFGAVAALWVLYHLVDVPLALAEARRVLRPGGLFVACTSARDNDPELIAGYPPTTFDAEEAAELVASTFGEVEVQRWDDRLVLLPDTDAVVRYARSHLLPAEVAEAVTAPLWLTKRGCLVWARRA